MFFYTSWPTLIISKQYNINSPIPSHNTPMLQHMYLGGSEVSDMKPNAKAVILAKPYLAFRQGSTHLPAICKLDFIYSFS